MQRVPKPWPADHPRAELLRRTGFQVRFYEALPKCVHGAGFLRWCTRRLEELLPIHRWLVAELGAPEAA